MNDDIGDDNNDAKKLKMDMTLVPSSDVVLLRRRLVQANPFRHYEYYVLEMSGMGKTVRQIKR